MLTSKKGVFESFLKFKALQERQTGRKILALRSDKGGKFNSEKFIKLINSTGIK